MRILFFLVSFFFYYSCASVEKNASDLKTATGQVCHDFAELGEREYCVTVQKLDDEDIRFKALPKICRAPNRTIPPSIEDDSLYKKLECSENVLNTVEASCDNLIKGGLDCVPLPKSTCDALKLESCSTDVLRTPESTPF